MTNRFDFRGLSSPTLYQEPTSAVGLRAHRTDISFQNITPDIVKVDVHVTNAGTFWSPASQVTLQTAPLGAFLPWQPLMTLAVPPLAPRTSIVVSDTAWVPQVTQAIPVAPQEGPWIIPGHRMQEYMDIVAREAREDAEQEAREARRHRRTAAILAADPQAILGRAGTHWAGNINILMQGKAVERHMAQALRVYPGLTNAALFFVGDRADGYRFELSGDVKEWQAELLESSWRTASVRSKRRGVKAGEFMDFASGMFMLLVRPPKGAEKGEVSVHVTRQSDGAEAVVEFNLDSQAKGAGCYTV